MAENIVANVEQIEAAGAQIRAHNDRIQAAEDAMRGTVNNLNSSWSGAAAEYAIGKFNKLVATYSEARFKVLEEKAKALQQVVAPGYRETEAENVKLADSFL